MQKVTLIQEFEKGKVGISTSFPLHDHVPFKLLLNALLCAQCDLKPYSVAEGGIEGEEVQLRNSRDLTIGLWKDSGDGSVTATEEKVLRWYVSVLKILFIEGSPGAILPGKLWFDPNYKERNILRLELFRKATLYSDWHILGKDYSVEKKVRIWDQGLTSKIRYFSGEHLCSCDLVSISDREVVI